MALVYADRVQDTTTTTGTGTITLAGSPPSGFQAFSVIGNGNTTYYTITSGSAWEVGIGTYSSTGPTLARTTILSSSNSGSAITLTGTSTVFVTYPAERAFSTDNTLGVGSGGTGVTTSTGSGSVVLSTSPALINPTWNNDSPAVATIVTSAGTTTLTSASNFYQHLTGTSTHTVKLPDETTIPAGTAYVIDNDSTQSISVQDSAGGALATVTSGMAGYIYSMANTTATGNWGGYAYVPGAGPSGQVTWGTAGLSMGGQTITNSTWNGATVGIGYGGTGVTTTPANGALLIGNGTGYTSATLTAGSNITITNSAGGISIAAAGSVTSVNASGGTTGLTFSGGPITSSGTLTIGGTLAIANGGTNSTATPTAGGVGYGTGTAHAFSAAGSSGQPLISAGTGAPAFGTLGVAGGGTGATTFTSGYHLKGNGTSAVSSSTILYDSGTAIGIGTTSPNALLDLGATVSNKVFALYDDGSNQYGMGIASNLYKIFGATGAAVAFGTYARSTDTFTESMRLTSVGYLGIGTSSPAVPLEVAGSVNFGSSNGVAAGQYGINSYSTSNWNYAQLNIIRASSNTSTPRFMGLMLGGDSATSTTLGDYPALWGIYNATPTGTSTSSSLQAVLGYAAYYGHRWFLSGGTEAMRIDNSGNLLVGTTTSSALLTVNGTASVATSLTTPLYLTTTSSTTTGSTITPTASTTNQYNVTALASAATIAAPSGSAVDGQKLMIRLKDNGTARALTWTTSIFGYRAIGVTLPTTTVAGKVLYVGCIYNNQDGYWDVIAVAEQ